MTLAYERPREGRATLLDRVERRLPLAVVLAISVAYRFPRLANAGDLHSDSAVVGLQAMHFLRGEWSPFLWGSGYQTSVDSAVAALFFLVLGPTALALRLSTFLGYVALTLLVYLTLRRRVSSLAAAWLVSPLVLTPSPVHTYVFSPPRQAALTLVFLSVFLFEGVDRSRHPSARVGAASAALGFACFADPYALLFLPSVACVAIPATLAGDRARRNARAAAGVLGGLLGLMPMLALFRRSDATPGVLTLSAGVLAHNARLLVHECLPFLLSTKVYAPTGEGAWTEWQRPLWFAAVGALGAALFVAAILAGGALAGARRVGPELARLGALGATMLPVAVFGFLFSVMPLDAFSARYLVAIILTAPFAMAPVLERIGPLRFAALVSPYLVASAVAGWLGYGSEGTRLTPIVEVARDDRALVESLRARGIRYGLADYWGAYRLTFLSREELVIAPWHASQDRYAPYRARVAGAGSIAYVFDPLESLEKLGDRESLFRSGETEYAPDFETLHVGRFTVLVLHRLASARAAPRAVFGAAAL